MEYPTFYGRLCERAPPIASVILLKGFDAYTENEDAQARLTSLYQGLLAAEEQAVQMSKELSGILDHLRHLNRVENSSILTEGDMQSSPQMTILPGLPNAHLYLLHLKDNEDSLVPNVLLGQGRKGEGFFWGLTPVAGDYILISFLQPQTVKGYLFRSGNIETNVDKFCNTTVEVLPSDASVLENIDQRMLSKNGFLVIGSFVNGLAEGTIESPLQRISAMRLLIHTDSDFWVLLSEKENLGLDLQRLDPKCPALLFFNFIRHTGNAKIFIMTE